MARETISDVAPSGNVATHDVGIRSMAGTTFWTLLFSFILYLVGFSTMGWQKYYGENIVYSVGLWSTCMCQDVHVHQDEAWFKASKAMFTMGLLCMVGALGMIMVYMYVHRVRKSISIVVACTLCFVSAFFLLVGLSVFGGKTGEPAHGNGHQSYSFVLTVISLVFTLVSGCLSVYQMRIAGMFGNGMT